MVDADPNLEPIVAKAIAHFHEGRLPATEAAELLLFAFEQFSSQFTDLDDDLRIALERVVTRWAEDLDPIISGSSGSMLTEDERSGAAARNPRQPCDRSCSPKPN